MPCAISDLSAFIQAAKEESEYLADIESQLQMLRAHQADELQALQDIQAGV